MGEIADIKDRDSLQAWLEDQPRELSVWIASRAAARVLPVLWRAVLTEGLARARGSTALPLLRDLLISTVAACVPTDAIRSAAFDAATSDAVAFDAATAEAAARAASAAYAAATDAAADAATVAATAAITAVADWNDIRTDAKHVLEGRLPVALSLWPDGPNPLDKEWSDIKAQVAASPNAADWQFWLDWYDAQLAGRTMLPDPALTWDMLEQIALIDTATWEAGPEVVNPKIREIRELYRLRAEVAALQAQKDAFLATRASEVQRSHNQPPEGLVDEQPEVARQITIVGNSLDEARDALEQDAPDKGWLCAIAEKLLSALTAVTKYCAKVADTAVISAAKVGGGAGGAAMVDYFANNGRLMQFAKDLLSYAAGV